MSRRPDASRNRRDGVTIPTIWVAVALSALVHVAALWQLWPHLNLLPLTKSEVGDASSPLTVRLSPLPGPAPLPEALLAPQARPSPNVEARRLRPPKTPRRPTPPVIVLNRPAPGIPAPPPAVSPPAPAPPSVAGDMASYIEARRRARGEPAAFADGASNAPSTEDDNARGNRIAAANLASQRQMTFGYDPAQGGGMFQIERMGYDDAEFLFFGWNKNIRRKTKQLIEVRKGSNSDIRIAVIRKMIAIIREYEQGDFLWESARLGRDVTLSARAGDDAGLEEFLMREFFPDTRPSR
jgi:hypothetical protein